MKCADAAERITALVDGELPAAERTELERHLRDCASCREARAAEEEVAARVRSLGRPPLPDGFREAVMGRVLAATPPSEAAPRSPGRVIPLWTWVAAGGAVAAGLLAMVTFGDGRGGREALVAGAPKAPAAAPSARVLAGPEKGATAPADAKLDSSVDRAVPAEEAVAADAKREDDERAEAKSGNAREGGARRGPVPATKPPADPVPMPGGAAGPPESRTAETGEAPPPPAEPVPAAPTAPAPGPPAGGGTPQPEAPRKARAPVVAKEKPAAKGERPAVPRVAVFYRTLNPAEAERSVDRLLFLNRDLSLETVGWKDASEVDSASGRLLRDMTAADPGNVQEIGLTAARPRDRVLQVRLRAQDLERLRREVGGIASMQEASSVVLVGNEGLIPEELEKQIRTSLEDAAKRLREEDRQADGEAGFTQGGAPGKDEAKGGGGAGGSAGEELAPPPMPSKKLLEKLAEGPDAAKAGGPGGAKASETADVWLEIHVVATPPPK